MEKKIGSENLIGTGSQILQYLSVGNDNVIGSSTLVSKDIVEPGVYVGIPARKIKSR